MSAEMSKISSFSRLKSEWYKSTRVFSSACAASDACSFSSRQPSCRSNDSTRSLYCSIISFSESSADAPSSFFFASFFFPSFFFGAIAAAPEGAAPDGAALSEGLTQHPRFFQTAPGLECMRSRGGGYR